MPVGIPPWAFIMSLASKGPVFRLPFPLIQRARWSGLMNRWSSWVKGCPAGAPQVVGVSFGRRVGFGVLLYPLFCCLGHLVFSRWCFVAAGCSGARGDKWLGAGEVGDVVVVGASEDAVAAAFANGMKVPEFFVPLRTEQRGVAGASGASVAVAARGRRGFLCLPV